MARYQQLYGAGVPQAQPRDNRQVKNNAGGYVYKVDHWQQLERFLILGVEGPTYYAKQGSLLHVNANSIIKCIHEDGTQVMDMVIDVSCNGRAVKNDPALFVLALVIKHGDLNTRRYAYDNLRNVARIPTHLFNFLNYCKAIGKGWSQGLRNAVNRWYEENENLPYHLVKYRQREGWTHRDVLRLTHPKPKDDLQQTLYNYIVDGWESVGDRPHPNKDLQIIWAYERARDVDLGMLLHLIEDYGLTWEMIPTEFLNNALVWEYLIPNLPLTALLRNLGKITSLGIVDHFSDQIKVITGRLANADYIHKSRIHPLSVLVALKTYAQGHGVKGSLNWNPNPRILDALTTTFYVAFDNVEPTGKRFMLGIDVSGSMGASLNNLPLSCREAAAAMALVTANTEQDTMLMGFTRGFVPLKISPHQRLDDVVEYMKHLNFGGTDCAQPMIYALQHNIRVDVFVVYTDNETWAGNIHPAQALTEYQQRVNPHAKLVVVSMLPNEFSIADPQRFDMLDIVGFDTGTPAAIASFVKE